MIWRAPGGPVENADPEALIADKVRDALPAHRQPWEEEIASRQRPTARPDRDFALYRERNLIDRFFNKIKHFRAIVAPTPIDTTAPGEVFLHYPGSL